MYAICAYVIEFNFYSGKVSAVFATNGIKFTVQLSILKFFIFLFLKLHRTYKRLLKAPQVQFEDGKYFLPLLHDVFGRVSCFQLIFVGLS